MAGDAHPFSRGHWENGCGGDCGVGNSCPGKAERPRGWWAAAAAFPDISGRFLDASRYSGTWKVNGGGLVFIHITVLCLRRQ